MTSSIPSNFNYLFKYIIIGDSNVGKSNILTRYTQDKFNEQYQATIGVEFGAKNLTINNQIIRVQIWDTAGQENFRSITRAYYKNSVCAIIVYDISNRDSFNSIQNWIEDCKMQSPETVHLVLVGNKCDLDKREVTKEEGLELANKNKMVFFESSAKNNIFIDDIFNQSAKTIYDNIEKGFYDLNNENCGIKIGVLNNNNNINSNIQIDNNSFGPNNFIEGCCR